MPSSQHLLPFTPPLCPPLTSFPATGFYLPNLALPRASIPGVVIVLFWDQLLPAPPQPLQRLCHHGQTDGTFCSWPAPGLAGHAGFVILVGAALQPACLTSARLTFMYCPGLVCGQCLMFALFTRRYCFFSIACHGLRSCAHRARTVPSGYTTTAPNRTFVPLPLWLPPSPTTT